MLATLRVNVFLANGDVIVTLWRVTDPSTAIPFDRKHNVGLHHLAFAVDSFAALDALHARLELAPGVRVEFAPEPLSGGPAGHMMIREPSGNRLESTDRRFASARVLRALRRPGRRGPGAARSRVLVPLRWRRGRSRS
jgi:hypothetical protein